MLSLFEWRGNKQQRSTWFQKQVPRYFMYNQSLTSEHFLMMVMMMMIVITMMMLDDDDPDPDPDPAWPWPWHDNVCMER